MQATMLLDSDIIIHVLRKNLPAVDFVAKCEDAGRVAISVITRLEVLVGAKNKQEQEKIDRFLDRFETIPIDPQTSDKAVELFVDYRLSHGLAIPDCLIAATALRHALPLATGNLRDFRFIPALQLEAFETNR